MKQEELLREFLDLPPEGQAEVVDLIEFLRSRYRSRDPNGQDSSPWVRGTREREWVK